MERCDFQDSCKPLATFNHHTLLGHPMGSKPSSCRVRNRLGCPVTGRSNRASLEVSKQIREDVPGFIEMDMSR